MIRSIELRRDERSVGGLLAGMKRAERENTRQLDLELNGAVLIEIPEKSVFIILNGGGGRHHQAARTAHLGLFGQTAVRVVPENAEILFMDADRIGDRQQ